MPEHRGARLLAGTEAGFLKAVLQAAGLWRWRTFHVDPARARSGRWLTPVRGDGAGFPDLLLLRGPVLLWAELKMPGEHPTPEQEAWLADLHAAGEFVYLWYPCDWPGIQRVLERGPEARAEIAWSAGRGGWDWGARP
jgi:hypothetical protein